MPHSANVPRTTRPPGSRLRKAWARVVDASDFADGATLVSASFAPDWLTSPERARLRERVADSPRAVLTDHNLTAALDHICRQLAGESQEDIAREIGRARQLVSRDMLLLGDLTGVDVRGRLRAGADSRHAAYRAAQARVDADLRQRVQTRCRPVIAEQPGLTVRELAHVTALAESDIRRRLPAHMARFILNDATPHSSKWSEAATLEAIRTAAAAVSDGAYLTGAMYSRAVSAGDVLGPALPTVCNRFGTWTAATRAAGLRSGEVLRAYRPAPTDLEAHTAIARFLLDPTVPAPSSQAYPAWARRNRQPALSSMRGRGDGATWSTLVRAAARLLAPGGLYHPALLSWLAGQPRAA